MQAAYLLRAGIGKTGGRMILELLRDRFFQAMFGFTICASLVAYVVLR